MTEGAHPVSPSVPRHHTTLSPNVIPCPNEPQYSVTQCPTKPHYIPTTVSSCSPPSSTTVSQMRQNFSNPSITLFHTLFCLTNLQLTFFFAKKQRKQKSRSNRKRLVRFPNLLAGTLSSSAGNLFKIIFRASAE